MENNSPQIKEFVSSRGVLVTATDISLIFIAVMCIICVVSYFFPYTGITFGAVSLVLYFLSVFLFVPLYYSNLSYSADKNSINIKNGFFIHRYTRITLNDIQYCIISQGLIQKIFRCYSVYIMLTGSFTIISNISLDDANMINELASTEIIDGSGDINEEGH